MRAKVLALALVFWATSAGANPARPLFGPPTPDQRQIIAKTLGAAFVKGIGVFPPALRVVQVNFGGTIGQGLIAVQKGFCSNRSCTFELLRQTSAGWRRFASLNSWGVPYVVEREGDAEADIVIFDHRTKDCMACSPPQPVMVRWHLVKQKHGGYREITIPTAERPLYQPSWDMR
jgi:hypothetical protein